METITLEITPPVATLTLNRPEVRNAISPALISEMRQAFSEIRSRPELTAVIVTGAGKAFSAGADIANLKEVTDQPVEEARLDSLDFMNFFREIYEFPLPVIAAVNGAAIGGGCGIASVADVVVAAEHARFGYTEARVGYVPALVSVFLVRICGEKKARELLMTARLFDAEEAREIGLVNYVVAAEDLLDKAREVAAQISANSPTAIVATKQLMRDIQGLNLDEALSAALHINTLTRTTENFREGVTAFLEKRTPEWKARSE